MWYPSEPGDLIVGIMDDGIEPNSESRPALTATAGDGWIDMQWTPGARPPGGTGRMEHYEYRIDDYRAASGWTAWRTIEDGNDPGTERADERELRLTGMRNGDTRRLELRAVSNLGAGAIASAEALPRPYLPLPSNRLVSNISGSMQQCFGISRNRGDQPFTTGPHAGGYQIEGVDFYACDRQHVFGSQITVQICKVDDDSCVTLSPKSGSPAHRYEYDTDGTFTAQANTTYELRTTTPGNGIPVLGVFNYNAFIQSRGRGADAGSTEGWSIGKVADLNGAILMRLRGTEATGGGQATTPQIADAAIREPTGNAGWTAGTDIDVTLTFDEPVEVDTAQGTPSVGLTLGAGTAKSAAYTSGSGSETLVFRHTIANGEGPYESVRLEANSLALNGGTITSTASGAAAELAHEAAALIVTRDTTPETAPARFADAPAAHDGSGTFRIGLIFSGDPGPGVASYTTVRDRLLNITGGQIQEARRKTQGSNAGWTLTVAPSGDTPVTLTLPARACGTPAAVCVGGTALAEAVSATVPGPHFNPRFSAVPEAHDGENPFTVNFHLGATPRELSYVTVRDSLFAVSGASIANAKRITRGNDEHWTLTIDPTSDAAANLDLVATTACDTPPGVCDGAGRPLTGPLSLTVEGPATLSVADTETDEAEGATLDFTVNLSRALETAATVDYATSDGSATAGEDYTARSGTLTFNPGETEKTIAVTVLDDAHDEGKETMRLTLSSPKPRYVKLARATATGTINNTDPMPRAWAIRFGRTVGTQVVDALEARLGRSGASHVTVGGVTLGETAGEERETDGDDPFALPEWADKARDDELRTMNARELVLGSRFHLERGRDGGQPGVAAWGHVAESGFEAEEAEIALEGEVRSGLLGFDAQWERALAGMMLSYSDGEGTYSPTTGEEGGGAISSSMSGIYPYASLEVADGVSAWGIAGAGWGELTLAPAGQGLMRTDLTMRLGAAGVRGALLDEDEGAPASVTVKADALWVQTRTAKTLRLAASEGHTSRLRVALEGRRTFETGGGGRLTPLGEIGLRSDGGDAETGLGIELGAGLAFEHGRTRIEARLRTLAAHEDSEYEEWGAAASIRVAPGTGGRGLTLTVRPEWGATTSARERLWGARDARELAGNPEYTPGQRLAVDTGYGFGAAGGVLTPFAGTIFGAEGERMLRAGAGWTWGQAISLRAEAVRNGRGDRAANEIGVQAAIRF